MKLLFLAISYTVLDTIYVNGKLTLDGNMADLGGLNIAYAAFMNIDQYKKEKPLMDLHLPNGSF